MNDSADDRIQIELRTLDTGEMLSEYAFHVFTEHGAPPGMVPGVTDDLNARDPSSGPPPAGSESFSIGSVDTARMSLQAIDFQIDYVNKARSSVGAVQNRLDSALNNIETYTENLGASESRIRDADFAHETAEMSKFQVMQQAGVAILGQANGMSQGALRLI